MCLSLLGTWHGGDATEKWDPQHSNLFQVCDNVSVPSSSYTFIITMVTGYLGTEFICSKKTKRATYLKIAVHVSKVSLMETILALLLTVLLNIYLVKQVLVSIQGLILIKDPMFNEPSYEKIQGTKEGDVSFYQLIMVTMMSINSGRLRVLSIMLTFMSTL